MIPDYKHPIQLFVLILAAIAESIIQMVLIKVFQSIFAFAIIQHLLTPAQNEPQGSYYYQA